MNSIRVHKNFDYQALCNNTMAHRIPEIVSNIYCGFELPNKRDKD